MHVVLKHNVIYGTKGIYIFPRKTFLFLNVTFVPPEHFSFHRPTTRCFPFRVELSKDRGMHMVAARDIKERERERERDALENWKRVNDPFTDHLRIQKAEFAALVLFLFLTNVKIKLK
jgi:hypothetical protein